jgi:hypothetical protein
MKVENLIQLIDSNNFDDVKHHLNTASNNAIKKVVRYCIGEIENCIQLRRFGASEPYIKLIILVGLDDSIDYLKKKGLLRHSKYLNFKQSFVFYFISVYKSLEGVVSNRSETVNYLESLSHMADVYNEFKRIERYLTGELNSLNKKYKSKSKTNYSFVRSVLSFVELTFLKNKVAQEYVTEISNISFFGKEFIAEGASLVISRWDNMFGLKLSDFYQADVKLFSNGKLEELLFEAVKFKYLQEIEIKIESFGYVVEKIDNSVVIRSNDETTGKCSELSTFIKSKQGYSDFIKADKYFENLLSTEILYEAVQAGFPKMLEVKYLPLKRYVFNIPSVAIKILYENEDFLLTKEEMIERYFFAKEVFIPDGVDSFVLKDNLTVENFLRIRRLLKFIYEVFSKSLIGEFESNPNEVFNALSVVINEDSFYEYFHVVEDSIAEDLETFLDIVTWVSGNDDFLDLQYNPILYVDGRYVFLPAVFKMSNLLRNIVLSESKKGNNINGEKVTVYNSLVMKFSKILENNGFQVYIEVPIKYVQGRKTESDIDVLAIKNGCLYLFECKDSVYSVSPYEKRTVYNAMLKAADQLEYLIAALGDANVLHQLNLYLGSDIKPENKKTGVILTTNREYFGGAFKNYPVRNFHEMQTFFDDGKWYLGTIEDKKEIHNWKGNSFELSDLDVMLSLNKSPHRIFLNAMETSLLQYSKSIYIERYLLSIEKYNENIASANNAPPSTPL